MKINILTVDNIINLLEKEGKNQNEIEKYIKGLKEICKLNSLTYMKDMDLFLMKNDLDLLKDNDLFEEFTCYIDMINSRDDYAIISDIFKINKVDAIDNIYYKLVENNDKDFVNFVYENYLNKEVAEGHFEDIINFSIKDLLKDKVKQAQRMIDNNDLIMEWK